MMPMLWLAALLATSPSSWNGSTLQLLRELDQCGVRYPPTATRRELEALLDACESTRASNVFKESMNTGIDKTNGEGFDEATDGITQRLQRRKRRQRRHQQHKQPRFSDVLLVAPSNVIPSAFKSRASRLIDQGYREVRRVKRDLVDAWMENEDGVRTVPYQYVERYNDIDTVKESYPCQQSRRNPSRDLHDRHQTCARPPSRIGRRIRRQQGTKHTPNHQLGLPPAGESTGRPIHRPKSLDDTQKNGDWQRPRQRRIYNPYENSHRRGDLLDDIGSFFVEAADRAVWGSNSKGVGEKQSKRDWRDKLEERFDSILGIHNDDEPYRRWADGTEGRDTIIRQRRKRRGSSFPQSPIWGDGSIVSLIFNSREPRFSNFDDVDTLWESSGSVLVILRWSVRRLARYYGNICRWATVDRTIPQSAVVTLVTSVLLSITKRRWLAAGIALVLTRAVGEAVRESSSVGWDSPNGDEDSSKGSENVTETGDD